MIAKIGQAYPGAHSPKILAEEWGGYEAAKDERLRVAVTDIIHELGVPANIKGYFYLREAILFKLSAPDTLVSLTKTLYPSIGKMFNTSSGQVERAIRHAIGVAWSKGSISSQQDSLGYSITNFSCKPKNSELIATIVDRIKLWYN